MKPREYFPNMPDELFNNWLAPLIADQGWPFNSLDDDIQQYYWKFNLGIHHTLRQWYECEWGLTSVPFSLFKVHPRTVATISDIIVNAVEKKPTPTTDLIGGADKFWACATFYKEKRTIPWPIVVYATGGLFTLVDGFHRVAVLSHFGAPDDFQLPAWEAIFK